MAEELAPFQQRQLVTFQKMHPEAQAIPGEGFLAICASHDSRTGEVVAYHVTKYHPWGAIAGHVTEEDMTRERAEGALISETIQALVIQRDQLGKRIDGLPGELKDAKAEIRKYKREIGGLKEEGREFGLKWPRERLASAEARLERLKQLKKDLPDHLEAITHRLDQLGIEAEVGLEAVVPDVL